MAILGLDIGTKTIKAVQLEKQGDRFLLVAAGITSTPQGTPLGSEQDTAAKAEAVKKLINDAKITARETNLSLPETHVFTRLIELPALTDEEVGSAISWQAESYIPIPLEEASIDYQIIGRRGQQNTVQASVQVLLVAAPRNLVDNYVRIAGLAGLAVGSVETEMMAISRSVSPTNATVIIMDLGGSSTNLALVKSGQLVMTRSIATGGEALTRAVAKNLGVSPQQAEEYKKAYGLSKKQLEGKVRASLESPLKIIADEIKKAIQYYKSELKMDDPVAEVILTGGSTGIPEITSFLAENLGIEIGIGDPFSRIVKDERLNQSFMAYAPLYGVAIGLAEKG